MPLPDPKPIRQALEQARTDLSAAKESATAYAKAANSAGVSEYQIAQSLGVTRMTTRAWLGKNATKT